MSNKYIVTAEHDKGYDLQFETLYLTEEGLKQFKEQFESKCKEFYEKTDYGYNIESDTSIVITKYKPLVFQKQINIDEISFADEGHGNTFLNIEYIR